MAYNTKVQKLESAIGLALILGLVALSLYCRQSGERGEGGKETAEAPGAGLAADPTLPGRIVFQSDMDGDGEIYLLERGRVTRLTDNDWEDRYPRWSPDGRAIAFTANPSGNFDIFVMDDKGGEVTPVIASPLDELDPAWSPDGRAIAFSEEKKKVLGKARSIWVTGLTSSDRERLVPAFDGPHQLPDFSRGLPLLAFTGKRTRGWDVFLWDLESGALRSLTQGGKSCRPRFSPDGQRIAFVSSEADGKGDIWISDADGRNRRRLTLRDDAYDYFPSWSPDGEWVVFGSSFDERYADRGAWGLFLVRVKDGSVVSLLDSPGRDVFPDWR